MISLKKNTILGLLICSIPFLYFFSSFSIFSIGTFNFDLSFLGSLLIIIFGILTIKNYSKKSVIMLVVFTTCVIFSVCANTPFNFESALLYLYFAIFYFFLFNSKITISKKTLSIYLGCLTLVNSFGIVQFLLQFTSIGFLDFQIANHVSQGFNTTNYIYLNDVPLFFRAHSIYLEPSILSQQSAIAVGLLMLNTPSGKKNRILFYISIIANLAALLLSFAGTGLILLLAILLFMIFESEKYYKFRFLALFVGFLLFAFMVFTNFGRTFFASRISEILNKGTSAHVRFVLPFKTLLSTLLFHSFGYGPGNVSIPIALTNSDYPYEVLDVANSWSKIGSELGVFGILIYLIFYLYVYKTNRLRNELFNLFFIIVVLQGFLNQSLLTSEFTFITILFLVRRPIQKFKKGAKYYEKNTKYRITRT